MDDRTLLEAFYILAAGIDRAAGPEPAFAYPGMPRYGAVASRIRALAGPSETAPPATPAAEIPEELKALVRAVRAWNRPGSGQAEEDALVRADSCLVYLPDHLLRACGIEER